MKLLFSTSCFIVLAAHAQQELQPIASANADAESCWVEAYGRGVGKPITSCPADKEKDGALCYPLCRDGYNGVGPVCW